MQLNLGKHINSIYSICMVAVAAAFTSTQGAYSSSLIIITLASLVLPFLLKSSIYLRCYPDRKLPTALQAPARKQLY